MHPCVTASTSRVGVLLRGQVNRESAAVTPDRNTEMANADDDIKITNLPSKETSR
jgi:hypothetical protein